jgi:hypothetical protein
MQVQHGSQLLDAGGALGQQADNFQPAGICQGFEETDQLGIARLVHPGLQ